MNKNNQTLLFKLVSGELIIGTLLKDFTNETNDLVLFIHKPASIFNVLDNVFLTKYNPFSKNDFIMIPSKHVMFIDYPNEAILKIYSKFLIQEEMLPFLDENKISIH